MKTRLSHRARVLPVLAAVFAAGVLVGWWLRDHPPLPVSAITSTPRTTPGTGAPSGAATGEPTISAALPTDDVAIQDLRRRDLRMPIDGVDIERLKGMFAEPRAGDGGHPHDAVDILAPRNTPVHATEDGVIMKLFFSKAGGITIYQFDPAQQFCYYYAHLERYADGLHEGRRVARGEVIGYVGTSGNAPPGTPHLHFSVYTLTPEHRWWQGHPIDPYLVFHH